MKKRPLELFAVVAVIAGVVSYTQQPEKSVPAPPKPAVAASPLVSGTTPAGGPQEVPTLVQTSANHHWKSLFDEAQMALNQGDNARAEAQLVAALKLAPRAGESALHETLDDLGLVCYRLGEYQRSADYQRQAVEAARQLPSPQSSPVVALYESRYALALEALDQRSEALAALDRAETAFKEAYPAGSPAYSEAMSSLAAQHRSMGNNDAAARLAGE